MFRGDWGNTTNKQMPRIGNTDSWHFCRVWPHLPCLLLMCPYKLSCDSKYSNVTSVQVNNGMYYETIF